MVQRSIKNKPHLRITLQRQERYKKAIKILEQLKNILIKKYGVKRIILIGSLNEPERFGFHSDIDLCVEGLKDELYFRAVGELLMLADDFDVDIIPMENATKKMKDKIKQGKEIYVKR